MKNTAKIQKAFGLIMIITAVGIFFNIDRSFQTYILNVFPNYGIGLTAIEDNDIVKQELDKIQNGTFNEEDIGKPMDQIVDQAPELIPGGEWINSDPLTLKELRGKVVLLDIWTYSCINCIRTLPYIQAWHEKYRDHGLVIIGVHTPEFEFEKIADNVRKAAIDFGLTYPIMQDNNYATWWAYKNNYWPRKYLIDHTGKIIYDHIGEGDYAKTEMEIINALEKMNELNGDSSEISNDLVNAVKTDTNYLQQRSPETYFGSARNSNLANGTPFKNGAQKFIIPETLKSSKLYLGGEWDMTAEYAQNINPGDKIVFEYQGKDVYLVASAENAVQLSILRDGKKPGVDGGADLTAEGTVNVTDERLYRIIEGSDYGTHTLEIIINQPGLRAFAFTFG